MKAQKRLPKVRAKRDADGKSTYSTSLELFQAGMPIAEIAATRGFTSSTIEGHLLRYLPTGEVNLEDLVSEEKVKIIRQALIEHGGEKSFGQIKELLGEEFSYGEIRAVQFTM